MHETPDTIANPDELPSAAPEASPSARGAHLDAGGASGGRRGAGEKPMDARAWALDTLGLALYIAWSFLMWNGPLVVRTGELAGGLPQLLSAQSWCTVVAALVAAFAFARLNSRRARLVGFVVGALLAAAAPLVMAVAAHGALPSSLYVIGFAMTGVGSTYRLFWEERLSLRGVGPLALAVACAYAVGFAVFALASLLPYLVMGVFAAALPVIDAALFIPMLRRFEAPPAAQPQPGGDLGGARLAALGLLAIIALTFFGYGAVRAEGVQNGYSFAAAIASGVLSGVPALCSAGAVLLAFALYRSRPTFALYIGIPLMAVAALLPASADPFGGGTSFCIMLLGAELVKYVLWFLLVDRIDRHPVPLLACLAAIRFAQWAGSGFGQAVGNGLPGEYVAPIVLVALIAALLVAVGSPSFSLQRGGLSDARAAGEGVEPGVPPAGDSSGPDARAADESSGSDALAAGADPVVDGAGVSDAPGSPGAADPVSAMDTRVAQVAEEYGLSPREVEVFGLWVAGYTSPLIEERLFISKSTVKTHLTHIYEKTGTSNKSELIDLIRSGGAHS